MRELASLLSVGANDSLLPVTYDQWAKRFRDQQLSRTRILEVSGLAVFNAFNALTSNTKNVSRRV